ncbi:MAG: C40 family peptidase [Rhodoferax sp.]|jgi:cell wall-associated NlpC family hydrolase|nr:C40 family peptidase [Rhodoferax sp.]MBP9734612.1 C40 family peptidase [Rhodoferax sp.]
MLFHPKLLVSLILALAVCSVSAGPSSVYDDQETTKAQQLLTQLDEVRQTVTIGATELVESALNLIGVPYRRGGTSTEDGLDCSGLVKTVYAQTLGLILPRRADQQAAATQKIDKTELQPGDLVFFNTMRRAFSHVGIYIGDGQFVHAPKPGSSVRVDNMTQSYWTRRFDGARRVLSNDETSPQVR